MNNFLKKYAKYVILFVGLVITVLLTIGLVYLNKYVFGTDAFKLIKDYEDKKVAINNCIGFGELLVVMSTFILFIKFGEKE